MTGCHHRLIVATVFSALILLFSCSLEGQNGTLFQDNFSPGLAQGWTWIREDPSAWRIADGALYIRTLSGTLWGSTNNAKNLLLRPAPINRDNWAVEVTISSRPELDGEQAGLLYYCDDDNYIKLDKEWKKNQVYVFLVREEWQRPKVIGSLPVHARAVTLRLSVENGRVRGEMNEAGTQSFRFVGECDRLQCPDIRIGAFTHVWPGKGPRWAKFTKFRISSSWVPN